MAFASSNTARRFLEAYPGGSARRSARGEHRPVDDGHGPGLGLRVDGEAAEASPAAVVRLIIERLGPAVTA